jgi:hypothetical protein
MTAPPAFSIWRQVVSGIVKSLVSILHYQEDHDHGTSGGVTMLAYAGTYLLLYLGKHLFWASFYKWRAHGLYF